MKVIVTKYLNVRVGAPSVNAPNYQYLAPGSELEIIDNIVEGDLYEDDNRWLKDEAGNYYWIGGTNYDELKKKNQKELGNKKVKRYLADCYVNNTLVKEVNYADLLSIDRNIIEGEGKKMNIGILDHPLSKDLPFNVFDRSVEIEYPASNHGNGMATLIAGLGKIKGIATKAIVHELPIYDRFGLRSSELLKDVIRYLEGNTLKNFVINVSQSFNKEDYTDFFKQLNSFPNVILIASAGTDNELTTEISQFPASEKEVISVGSVTKLKNELNICPEVDIILPELDYLVYKIDQTYDTVNGDSSACAIVTAMSALLLSTTEIRFELKSLKKALIDESKPYSQTNNLDTIQLINPHS